MCEEAMSSCVSMILCYFINNKPYEIFQRTINKWVCVCALHIVSDSLLFVFLSVATVNRIYEIGQHAAIENAIQKPVEAEQAAITYVKP